VAAVAGLVGWLLASLAMNVASVALKPVTIVQNWIRTSQTTLPVYLRDRAELKNQLQTLTEQVMASQALVVERDVLRAENDTLRDLATLTTDDQATIVAHVVAQPLAVGYDRLIINRGTRHGVVVGAPVYAGTGLVVGTIIVASTYQSVVELISSPRVTSTVYVFGPDIFTIATGQGGGVLKLGVPPGIPIALGDPVTLPAGSQAIVGSIFYLEMAPTQPEQFAYVSLPISLSTLRLVRVGTRPLAPISFAQAQERVTDTKRNQLIVPVPEEILIDISNQDETVVPAEQTSVELEQTSLRNAL